MFYFSLVREVGTKRNVSGRRYFLLILIVKDHMRMSFSFINTFWVVQLSTDIYKKKRVSLV